jgi:vancomycin permeability regulator SanA
MDLILLVSIGLLVVVLVQHIQLEQLLVLVGALVVLMLGEVLVVLVTTAAMEAQILVEAVVVKKENRDQHYKQAVAVPVSSSSLILHKYTKNYKSSKYFNTSTHSYKNLWHIFAK